MRKLILLILYTYFITNLFGQKARIDSLQKLLSFPKEDKNTVVRFYGVAQGYFNMNYRSLVFDAKNFDSMFFYTNKGIDLSKKIEWGWGYARGSYLHGSYYFHTNNYARSVSELLKSLEKFEKIKDTVGIVNCLTFIGIVYRVVEDYLISVQYEDQAYRLARAANDNNLVWEASYNLGYGYTKLKVPDSALHYLQLCNQLANTIMDTVQNFRLGWSYQGLGQTHLLMNNSDLALPYLYKAVAYSQKTNDPWLLSYSYESLSDLFAEIRNSDSALHYGNLLLEKACIHKHVEMYLASYERLATIYEGRNNDSSVKYYKLAALLKDSIFNSKNKSEIQNLTANEEERQKELLEKQKKDQQIRLLNIQYLSIVIGLVTFVILFFLFSRSIIANQKLIRFLGVLALLIVFEFISLYIHPYLAHATDDSPILMLLIMVCIAALLVPTHHRIQEWVTQKLVEKNKKIRLAAARKIIAELDT
jgi:tetratricopeptide (TPR) repeat protein